MDWFYEFQSDYQVVKNKIYIVILFVAVVTVSSPHTRAVISYLFQIDYKESVANGNKSVTTLLSSHVWFHILSFFSLSAQTVEPLLQFFPVINGRTELDRFLREDLKAFVCLIPDSLCSKRPVLCGGLQQTPALQQDARWRRQQQVSCTVSVQPAWRQAFIARAVWRVGLQSPLGRSCSYTVAPL